RPSASPKPLPASADALFEPRDEFAWAGALLTIWLISIMVVAGGAEPDQWFWLVASDCRATRAAYSSVVRCSRRDATTCSRASARAISVSNEFSRRLCCCQLL